MRKVFQYLAFALVLTAATVVAIQFIMLRASERENARLLGYEKEPQADSVLLAYLRYKGAP